MFGYVFEGELVWLGYIVWSVYFGDIWSIEEGEVRFDNTDGLSGVSPVF